MAAGGNRGYCPALLRGKGMPISISVLVSLASLLVAPAQDGPVAAIQAARARFNAAIATHDTIALDRDWADDITVIASRGAVTSGRAAYRASLIGQFESRPDVIYLRTPVTLVLHFALGMVTEEGDWTGSWTDDRGKVQVGGHYLAQWRLDRGRWLLHSEAFGLLRATR